MADCDNTPTDEQTPYRDLTGLVIRDEFCFALGGFALIYSGTLVDPSTGATTRVAVKTAIPSNENSRSSRLTIQRFNWEARVWYRLQHQNVLPFLGVCHDFGPSPALISPICKAGDLITYLDTGDSKIDRHSLLLDIANGLQYLHSQDIVHGDMKGQNVVIDEGGSARLCDFGQSRIIGHHGFTTAIAGSARFMAPELIMPDFNEEEEGNLDEDEPAEQQFTKESDVYGFSMVALQTLTSRLPFFKIRQDSMVILQVAFGKRPEMSSYENPPNRSVWDILEACWHQQPKSRPTMEVVIDWLSKLREPRQSWLKYRPQARSWRMSYESKAEVRDRKTIFSLRPSIRSPFGPATVARIADVVQGRS